MTHEAFVSHMPKSSPVHFRKTDEQVLEGQGPTTYLYTFPFPIYVDRENPPKVTVLARGSIKVRIYPPFRSAPANYLPMPPIAPSEIPFIKGATRLPASASATFRTLSVGPVLSVDGVTAPSSAHWQMGPDWGENAPRTFPMDSLRIDVLTTGKRGTVAEELATDLLSHLRWRSRQWWIGRSMDSLAGYLRQIALIRDDGTFISSPVPHAQFRTAGVHEIPITDSVWQVVAEGLNQSLEVPIHELLLNDGQFFAATNDVRRSILDSATACEYVKDMTAERLWRVANPGQRYRRNKVLQGHELPQHIARLERLSGRSLEGEFPGSIAGIVRLWVARNNVAHGQPPRVSGVPVNGKEASELNWVSRTCIDWMRSL